MFVDVGQVSDSEYVLLTTGLIVTGSWDKNIKLWDPRSNQCTGTYQQPEKVPVFNLFLSNKCFNYCTCGFRQLADFEV